VVVSYEATIYRYTSELGYKAIGPVLLADSTYTAESATRRLEQLAERGDWPDGEYHADLGNGVVAVIER
jgi:hypothetical protein